MSCSNTLKYEENENYNRKGDSLNNTLSLSHYDKPEIFFKDLPKPALIMKYSELNCSTCVDSVVAYVKRLEKLEIPIFYVASYSNRRDMFLFKKMNNLKNDVYKTRFTSSFDSLNIPYLYVVDKDYVQKSVYIPRKEDMYDYKLYLAYITKKYFSEKLIQ